MASRSEPATESVGPVVDPVEPRVATRSLRIPGVVGFDHCLKRPAVLRQGVFAFHVVAVDAEAWRLGLVIPKRFEKSAVSRNAIKRRWREAFRVRRADWANEFGGADLVVRMTAPLVPKRDPKDPTPKPTATQRARFDAADLLTTLTERLRTKRSLTKANA